MPYCLVIGGGRWGRIIAQKLSELSNEVNVVTEYKINESDISRIEMIKLNRRPDLIYIASKTENHIIDYEIARKIKTKIWVEKSFVPITIDLINQFLLEGSSIFNMHLFNHSIDKIKHESINSIKIISLIERKILNNVSMLDWLSHEFSIISRILWLNKEKVVDYNLIEISKQNSNFNFIFKMNSILINVSLIESDVRYRELTINDSNFYFTNWDGNFQFGTSDKLTAKKYMNFYNSSDLLKDSIKKALCSNKSDVNILTQLILNIQNLIFPKILTILA